MTALRILHVDDESDIREVVEISLGLDPDFVTRSCGSGGEALAVAVDWPPDIILLDVMMPMMDGPTTLAGLRDNAQTATIPVVFMTARAQPRELALFRSLGAVGVISKPFDPMTLAAAIRSYIPPTADGLDALRRAFLRRLDNDTAALAKHRRALEDETASPPAMVAIRQIAHGLAGAGGIFGFSEISDAAAALEEATIAEPDGSGSVDATALALAGLFACVETSRAHLDAASRSLLDA